MSSYALRVVRVQSTNAGKGRVVPRRQSLEDLLDGIFDSAQDALEDLMEDVREQAQDYVADSAQFQPIVPPQRPVRAQRNTAPPRSRPVQQKPQGKTLYSVLGIAPDAPQEVVEAAFKALARVHHPDVSKAKDGGERMRQINRAYEILRDAAKRKAYDRTIGR